LGNTKLAQGNCGEGEQESFHFHGELCFDGAIAEAELVKGSSAGAAVSDAQPSWTARKGLPRNS
jgi:hypothetical protein